LKATRIAAFQNEENVGGVCFQNTSEKCLGFRGEIVGALEPEDGGFGSTGPDVEFLATVS
jgi:hypothetical protein